MGNLVCKAELLNCRRAVAAADYSDCAGLCQCLGHCLGAVCELIELEYAHRSVPDDGACALYSVGEESDGLGADVHAHEIFGNVALGENRLRVCGEFSRTVIVDREQELDALGCCLGYHVLCIVDTIRFEQRLADLIALCLLEGVGHAAADDDGVSLLKEVIDDVYLIGDLCATEDSNERALGIVKSLAHDGQLLVDEQAGVCRQVCSNTGGGGVRSVHGAECVGHKDLRHVSKSLCKLGIVLLLADVKAEVLKKHDLAGLESCGLGLCILADDVLCKDHVHAEKLGKSDCYRRKRELGLPLALGLAKMRACDNCRAVVEQVLDGGHSGLDTLVAGDLAGLLVLGNVEVAAQQDLLALYVDIIDCLLVVIHGMPPI